MRRATENEIPVDHDPSERGQRRPLHEEENEEKITRRVGSRREPDVAAGTPTREAEEKIGRINGAIQGGGDRASIGVWYGPWFGGTKVAWDLEYIDLVHHSQHGAVANGII